MASAVWTSPFLPGGLGYHSEYPTMPGAFATLPGGATGDGKLDWGSSAPLPTGFDVFANNDNMQYAQQSNDRAHHTCVVNMDDVGESDTSGSRHDLGLSEFLFAHIDLARIARGTVSHFVKLSRLNRRLVERYRARVTSGDQSEAQFVKEVVTTWKPMGYQMTNTAHPSMRTLASAAITVAIADRATVPNLWMCCDIGRQMRTGDALWLLLKFDEKAVCHENAAGHEEKSPGFIFTPYVSKDDAYPSREVLGPHGVAYYVGYANAFYGDHNPREWRAHCRALLVSQNGTGPSIEAERQKYLSLPNIELFLLR